MNTLIAKTIGDVIKGGVAGQEGEVLAGIATIAAIVAPYVVDKAITFADKVMANKYRFQAGPVVFEPAADAK